MTRISTPMMCSTQMMVMPRSSRMRQHVRRLVHLGLVQTAQALVGQQQLRLGGQRAGHLQLLQAGRTHSIDPGLRVGGQADQLQCLARALLGRSRVIRSGEP